MLRVNLVTLFGKKWVRYVKRLKTTVLEYIDLTFGLCYLSMFIEMQECKLANIVNLDKQRIF